MRIEFDDAPYYIETEDMVRKDGNYWKHQLVKVYTTDGTLRFAYIYNYSGSVPFAPFQHKGEWYALGTTNYNVTQLMQLTPSTKWIGGIEPNNFGEGFCPVSYSIIDEDKARVYGCYWGDSFGTCDLDLSDVENGNISIGDIHYDDYDLNDDEEEEKDEV